MAWPAGPHGLPLGAVDELSDDASAAGDFEGERYGPAVRMTTVHGYRHDSHPSAADEYEQDNVQQPARPPVDRETLLKSLEFANMHQRWLDIETATKGTCQWLIEHAKQQAWATSPGGGLLWLSGKPGSGKSTLLKHIFSHHRRSANHNLTLSFFFHDRGDALQKTALGFFRSLAAQLLRAAPETAPDLADVYRQRRLMAADNLVTEWRWQEQDLEEYVELALPVVLKRRAVWLFIDALDESGAATAVGLLKWLKRCLETLSSSQGTLLPCRMCVSCRHYPIVSARHTPYEICADHQNREDILSYVSQELAGAESQDVQSSQEIRQLIVRRASSIFLWARWVVAQIVQADLHGDTLANALSFVDQAPDSLNNLYAQQISDMKQHPDSSTCCRLLQWIAYASRPLTLDELFWALAVGPDAPPQTREQAAQSVPDAERARRKLQSLSRGLAELTSSQDDAPVVQFIHQTVREFVLNDGLSILQGAPTAEEAERAAHSQMAKTCMRYLDMAEFSPKTDSRYFPFDMQNNAFSRYSWKCWHEHAGRSACRCDNVLCTHSPDHQSLADLVQHQRSTGLMSDWRLTGLQKKRWTRLSATLRQGLLGLLQDGLDSKNIDVKGRFGDTPLSFAAGCGNTDAVQLLLKMGAAVDSPDKDGRTPLSYAAKYGCEDVARLLLDKGALADSPDKDGRTPLFYAAHYGCKDVARLLLDKGALVDSPDKDGQTPLSCAAYYGRKDVARLLLDKGAFVDSPDNDGRTPLSYAASKGYEVIPVFHAVMSGHYGVARLLLDKGALVDSPDKDGRTPLSYAAECGNKKVAQLLLSRGAAVDFVDKSGQTPLSFAIAHGHNDVIKLLVDNGTRSADGDVSEPER